MITHQSTNVAHCCLTSVKRLVSSHYANSHESPEKKQILCLKISGFLRPPSHLVGNIVSLFTLFGLSFQKELKIRLSKCYKNYVVFTSYKISVSLVIILQPIILQPLLYPTRGGKLSRVQSLQEREKNPFVQSLQEREKTPCVQSQV